MLPHIHDLNLLTLIKKNIGKEIFFIKRNYTLPF
jgi:hypothetical protein